MSKLGKLENVEIRKVWKLETDFSDWLAEEDKLAALSEAIGIDLIDAKREEGVGDFSADIIAAEDGTDRNVIVENQYGRTNHDHLGKLITYASGTGAKTIVWIVEEAREEHRSAVQWLNEHIDLDIGFFLVQITVLRIGNSDPAPQFTVLERPNEWSKSVRGMTTGRGPSQGAVDAQKFYEEFMDYAMAQKSFAALFNRRKALVQNWMDLPCGSSVYWISTSVKQGAVSVSIYIGNSKQQYATFVSHKEEIERMLGEQLKWMELPDKKASRIRLDYAIDWKNPECRLAAQKWMAEKSVAFKRVFNRYARP